MEGSKKKMLAIHATGSCRGLEVAMGSGLTYLQRKTGDVASREKIQFPCRNVRNVHSRSGRQKSLLGFHRISRRHSGKI
jgi:hypothetical protein